MNIISFLILFPLIGSILMMFTQDKGRPTSLLDSLTTPRTLALNISLINFLASIWLWVSFNNSTAKFQFLSTLGTSSLLSTESHVYSQLNINPTFGVDGISVLFILLTTFLIPICILVGWTSINTYVKEYCIAFLVLESLVIAVFTSLDLLLFYVFFESVLIPMYIIIGVWGSADTKISASYKLFLYTLAGSIFMLVGILMIYFQTGTTDYHILLTTEFSESRQVLLWLSFFLAFAVKVPMVPFHIWLPAAHTAAPTAGSVILAGILLKLGTYAFLRFSIPLFPYASIYFTPLVYTLSVLAIIYTSLSTIRQVDLKKVIAYSSVGHMGVVTLGLLSLNAEGIEGSMFLQLGHGIVSPALFICVGILYDRHKTRIIRYYGGLVNSMPIFCTFFLVYTMANIGLPGLSPSFCGEFAVFLGTFLNNTLAAFLGAFSMILSGGYALWAYGRVAYGAPKQISAPHLNGTTCDVNRREFVMLASLGVVNMLLAIYPEAVYQTMHVSIANTIACVNLL
uniref:NADH-ubiquinone oxidoreductase chain 4 n=1 Tax=Oltmannsiellopsis viridis TaxID=51324 RepID=Q0QIR6_OLTVI|nr:NADH dehydrogenase subunit 4 [Oltmannsiellopsis viridis]ABC96338.1 NADH dehydrogenase subunit 4 [Oltmannsiellopsis viridis]